jgi:hypothetical protein
MAESYINRKKFLLKSAALLSLPFAATLISSCEDSPNEAVIPLKKDFDTYLDSKPTITAKTLKKVSGNENYAELPNSAFYDPYDPNGYFIVLRKVHSEGKTYMQFIQVKVIESAPTYKVVEGVNTEDIYYVFPRDIVVEMISRNRRETRERFLPIQLIPREA